MSSNFGAKFSAAGQRPEAIDITIPGQFEKIAASYANRIAIGTGSWQPTYAELDTSANSVAAFLGARCSPGSRIVLIEQLDGTLIGSMIGVLKAGCVFTVLNATEPLPRMREALKDLEPSLILTDQATSHIAQQVASHEMAVACFEEIKNDTSGRPSVTITADDLSVLLRTSGSTGRPKWVMQNHRNILHQAHRHIRAMQIKPDDRILLLASPSGSQALATTLTALLNGAAVCPFPIAEKGIIGLSSWLREHRVTIYISAASAFRYFIKSLRPEDSFPDVRLIKLGAEPMMANDLSAASRHFPQISAYYCTYSSSEGGSMAQFTWDLAHPLQSGRLPLGTASDGIDLLLLDGQGNPVPDGEAGEIVVRGRFLSPGYWNDLVMTAERFGEAGEGVRTFRTADLARREPDGSLMHLGRRDHVVKIHGQRVDVGHLEDAIKALPGIEQAVACARTRHDGTLELAAFVVKKSEAIATAETIHDALHATLPDVMLPSEIAFMDRLPLNPHGKIDRQALSARHSDVPNSMPAMLDTPTEQMLAAIWEQALDSPCGRDTLFFERGGDSLTAGVVAALVEAALSVQLNMLDFAHCPRLRDMAARIDQIRSKQETSDLPPLVRVQKRGEYPLSFAQERIWTYSQDPAAHLSYTLARAYEFKGALSIQALGEAMNRVYAQHEILRTSFPTVDGIPVQRIHPPEPVSLSYENLSDRPDARGRAIVMLREQASIPLDLAHGPILQFKLLRISQDEYWLLRISHIIVSDGWSRKLFFQELEQAYESAVRGEPPGERSDSLQYGDYALWERRVLGSGSPFRARIIEWWKSKLDGLPPSFALPFPRGFFSKRNVTPSDGVISIKIDNSLIERLAKLSIRESTTRFTVGLAAFAALLSTASRQRKVLIGTHVTGRGDWELQNIQGLFACLVPLCMEYDPEATFSHWLGQVRKELSDAQSYARLSPEEIWKDLRATGNAPGEIQVIFGGPSVSSPTRFSGMEFDVNAARVGDLELAQKTRATMPWGCTFRFDLNERESPCEVTFDARKYDRAKVKTFLTRYLKLLDRVSRDPNKPLGKLVL